MNKIKSSDPVYLRVIKPIWVILLLLFMMVFFNIVYAHVFSSQLGTADDAVIALAARNLAEGNGYSLSVPAMGFYGLEEFSVGITTGPVLVLPAALVIYIFGNTLWAPGLVTATFCLVFVLLITYHLQKRSDWPSALTYVVLILFFYYNISSVRFFTSWFVLLGELPATFLNLFAVFILVTSPYKRSTIITICLLFGLAFMTKMLSFLGFIPVLIWFAYTLIREKEGRRKLFISYFMGVIAFILPFILFEFWKLLSVGFTAYLENWYSFIGLFEYLALAKGKKTTSLFELLLHRNNLIEQYFGFSIILLILVGFIAAYLIFSFAKKRHVKLLFSLLMGAAVLHLFYWVFISIGWPRYALIGLFLYFSGISCILFVKLPRSVIITITLMFIVFFINTPEKLTEPVRNALQNGFNPNKRLKNLEKTVAFLEDYKYKRPFISVGWASVVSLEYSMDSLQNFKRFDQMDKADYTRPLIKAVNTNFRSRHLIQKYNDWRTNCDSLLFDAPPYKVTLCKHVISELKTNDTIDYSKNGNSNDYITYGWFFQNDKHYWTFGQEAGLVFSIPETVKSKYELQFLGVKFLAWEKKDKLKVTVLINDHYTTDWIVKKEKWFSVTILADMIADDGTVYVDFKFENPIDEFEFIDNRWKLRLGVKKMILKNVYD